MKTIYYKRKGNHSVNDLEKIVEQQKEELHQIKSGQTNWKLVDSDSLHNVSEQRELLCDFFKFFRDNGEANIGMTIEQFVDSYISHNSR